VADSQPRFVRLSQWVPVLFSDEDQMTLADRETNAAAC